MIDKKLKLTLSQDIFDSRSIVAPKSWPFALKKPVERFLLDNCNVLEDWLVQEIHLVFSTPVLKKRK